MVESILSKIRNIVENLSSLSNKITSLKDASKKISDELNSFSCEGKTIKILTVNRNDHINKNQSLIDSSSIVLAEINNATVRRITIAFDYSGSGSSCTYNSNSFEVIINGISTEISITKSGSSGENPEGIEFGMPNTILQTPINVDSCVIRLKPRNINGASSGYSYLYYNVIVEYCV